MHPVTSPYCPVPSSSPCERDEVVGVGGEEIRPGAGDESVGVEPVVSGAALAVKHHLDFQIAASVQGQTNLLVSPEGKQAR